MQLLDLLAKERRSLSLMELSQRTGWPKSTIHALLSTLIDYSMIMQDSFTGKYHLGMHLFELGNVVVSNWHALEVARPAMRKIMQETGESVVLGIIDRDEVLIIEQLDSGNPLRVMMESGTRLPLYSTALGKAMLAALPFSQAKRILKDTEFRAFTPHTITSFSELNVELERVRTNGYAIENGEMRVGMRAVAAPVYDVRGSAVYAVGVSGMFRRIQDEEFSTARDLIVEAARQISLTLGYPAVD